MQTETITTKTEKMVYGGEAMGRLPDGRAVFVPFALPGETVRARVIESKRGFARAELLEVLDPSPLRVKPLCAHFQVCGGCHYQHIPYPEQLRLKNAILIDQLERIGKLADPNALEPVPAPEIYCYRNHVQFHLDEAGALGYISASPETGIMAVRECHLPEEAISQVWRLLEFEAGTGVARVGLRTNAGGAGMDADVQVILESDELHPPDLSVEELDVSVVHLSPHGSIVVAGSENIHMEVLGKVFRVSAGSFFQANTAMAGKLVTGLLDGVARYIDLAPASVVCDLYCGVGLFSAFLAPLSGRLVGIESSPSAVDDFAQNLDEYDHVEIYEAEVEAALPGLDSPSPQLVVVDPPRAGLDRHALDALLRLQPELIAYISCDPSTLARDAKRLSAGGYRLREITLYDMFPQTYHIETLSFWTR